MGMRLYRDADDMLSLAISLQNLTECLCYLGQPGLARDAAAEALTIAHATDDREEIFNAHAYLGWRPGWPGMRPRLNSSSPPPTRSWWPTTRTVTTRTRCPGPGGRSGWPAPGGTARLRR